MGENNLGTFLPFLEKDWSIVITSDHGLICEEHHLPVLTEGCVSVPVMKELGYTVLKTDADGKELREIDWEKTLISYFSFSIKYCRQRPCQSQ